MAHSNMVAICKPGADSFEIGHLTTHLGLMASAKLTDAVSFCGHQLCCFLCRLPELASYSLWLCMFRDIWHLKRVRGRSGHGKNTQHGESCTGLSLKSPRMNNGLAELTPGEL